MEKQKCIKCKEIKDVYFFEHQKNRPNPRKKCKKCRQEERVYTEEQRVKRRKYAKSQRNVDGYYEKQKEYSLKYNYNIDLDAYNKMIIKQNKKCAICDLEFKDSKDTHVDHNHTNGNVRELLCGKCNSGIGLFKEDINVLENAIKYLKKHSFTDTPHFEMNV